MPHPKASDHPNCRTDRFYDRIRELRAVSRLLADAYERIALGAQFAAQTQSKPAKQRPLLSERWMKPMPNCNERQMHFVHFVPNDQENPESEVSLAAARNGWC